MSKHINGRPRHQSAAQPGWIALFAALAAAGCDVPAAPQRQSTQAMPAELCAKVRTALDELSEKSAVQFDGKGGAAVPDLIWLELGAERRGQLATSIAYDASCRAGGPGREQEIIIRNETGRILSQRTISTGVDMSGLLAD